MAQFITIQVGQCGNQIGSRLLPGVLQEHNSSISNKVDKSKESYFNSKQSLSSFFSFDSKNECDTVNELLDNKSTKARIICIDMEDGVISRFKTGPFGNLLDKKCLITNYPGSGNNWAEGYYNHGPKYESKILSSVQYSVEKCDDLQGFLLLFSVGGGTGSGLGTYVLKLLADHYSKVERSVACVYPTGTEDVITCPYNMVFATKELIDHATCVFPVENRALLSLISKRANRYASNYKHRSLFEPFEDMNTIIVDMLLHLTSGSRFPGSLNVDFNEINTNMVPFPKLKFLSGGFDPFTNVNCTNKQLKNELFLSAINRSNQLIKIDPLSPRHVMLSTMLLGRGTYTLDDMRSYAEKLQMKLRFAPWLKKGIKIGLCNIPPAGSDFAIFTLHNTSSMSALFENVLRQFTRLYKRKAHAHHYTSIPGFDSSHFKNCPNSLSDVVELYKSIEK